MADTPLADTPLAARLIEPPLDLEPIKARIRQATAGPWMLHERCSDDGEEDYWVVFNHSDDSSMMQRQDAEFIAHARQDIPRLIAEIERLQVGRLVDPSPPVSEYVTAAEFHNHVPWCKARVGATLTPEFCNCDAKPLAARVDPSPLAQPDVQE